MVVQAAAMAAAPMRPLITLRSHRGQIFPTSSAPVVLVVGTQVLILHLILLSLLLMEPPALGVVPLREVLVTQNSLAVVGLAVMVVVVVQLVLMVLEVVALVALVDRGTLALVVLVVQPVILVLLIAKAAAAAAVLVLLLAPVVLLVAAAVVAVAVKVALAVLARFASRTRLLHLMLSGRILSTD